MVASTVNSIADFFLKIPPIMAMSVIWIPISIARKQFVVENAFMVKKNRTSDRHKPSRNVRLRERLANQLQLLAERDDSNITEQTNRAVRELLVREGFWPPRTSDTDD